MRIAVIEYNQTSYVREVFAKHEAEGFKISSFVRWKPAYNNDNDIQTIDIEELEADSFDLYIICIKENRYLSRLLTYLHDKEISNLYPVRLYTMDKKMDFLKGATCSDDKKKINFDFSLIDQADTDKDRPFLVHLETHVCDHCNLNCKACNNFAPWVKKHSFTDPIQFEKDVIKLRELFSGIGRFFLLGGEPLLAPELTCEMIKTYRKFFHCGELRLLTNGLLIPKMTNEFWKCIRQYGVIIHISAYPPLFDKLQNVELLLQNKDIEYLIFKRVTQFVKRLTSAPYENAKESNELCGSGGCHYLRNGVISKCPDAILVENMNPEIKSKDVFNVFDVENAYELVRRLDAAIDLCQYCAQKEKEIIEWEPVGNQPLEKDWYVPNRIVRLEKENTELKANLLKQDDDIARYKAEIERLCLDVKHFKEHVDSLCFQNVKLMSEIQNNKESIEEAQKTIIKLKSAISHATSENRRIISSFSYRVGRVITFFPRKMRRTYKAVRNYGFKSVIKYHLGKIGGVLKDVVNKCVVADSLNVFKVFHEDIYRGYKQYSCLIKNNGLETTIVTCAYHGTGDYYFCGLLLDRDANILLLYPPQNNYRKIIQLFPVLSNRSLAYIIDNISSLINLYWFCPHILNYRHVHHSGQYYRSLSITSRNLQGFHGLQMLDFYRMYGKGILDNANNKLNMPVFIDENSVKDKYFSDGRLKIGKVALLAPYSTGLSEYAPQKVFWEKIVKALTDDGYDIFTNCFGKELPIKGTKKIEIDYDEIVPFLNNAGLFIGLRSGLCDIVSSSSCKKIIVHLVEAKWWPNGRSIQYTGLKHMGLSEDAFEVIYDGKDFQATIYKILECLREIKYERFGAGT